MASGPYSSKHENKPCIWPSIPIFGPIPKTQKYLLKRIYTHTYVYYNLYSSQDMKITQIIKWIKQAIVYILYIWWYFCLSRPFPILSSHTSFLFFSFFLLSVFVCLFLLWARLSSSVQGLLPALCWALHPSMLRGPGSDGNQSSKSCTKSIHWLHRANSLASFINEYNKSKLLNLSNTFTWLDFIMCHYFPNYLWAVKWFFKFCGFSLSLVCLRS